MHLGTYGWARERIIERFEGLKATYMYGPGRSFMALKQRQVSSTSTGPWIWEGVSTEKKRKREKDVDV